jgi:hypothetical protein
MLVANVPERNPKGRVIAGSAESVRQLAEGESANTSCGIALGPGGDELGIPHSDDTKRRIHTT